MNYEALFDRGEVANLFVILFEKIGCACGGEGGIKNVLSNEN